MIQEILTYLTLIAAVAFLLREFFFKKSKKSGCDSCSTVVKINIPENINKLG